MRGQEIRCFFCRTLLRKFDGDEPVHVAKTVGTCCAGKVNLPQASCYPTPPEPLE